MKQNPLDFPVFLSRTKLILTISPYLKVNYTHINQLINLLTEKIQKECHLQLNHMASHLKNSILYNIHKQ